jgi:hemolysin activation/secretion protein
MPTARLLAWLLLGLAPLSAGGQEKLPSFDELEAAGAIIGEIRVDTQDIFDLNDPSENNFFYRTANRLHVNTRPWLLRRLLLFKTGDRLSHAVINETERVIRAWSSVYDVSIRPIRYENGVVDLEVRTRDTWTLSLSASLSRSGGENTGGFSVKESNLAGTGTIVELSHTQEVDRSGNHVKLAHEHLFDGWTTIAVDRSSYTDGYSSSFNVARPFYSLDTRLAGGVSATSFERNDAIYRNGENIGEYRHNGHAAEAYGGWSAGRVGRWTQRYSVGVSYTDDTYVVDPANPPPTTIPPDRTISGPFLRHEVIEDNYLEVMNRDSIQRPEYLAMGFHSSLQIGRSLASFGASEEPWLVSGSVSKGFRAGKGEILADAAFSAQYGTETGDVRTVGVSARYFAPQTRSFLLYFSAKLDAVQTASAADELLLGGDNGVRGYPLRYQAGTRRAVFTAEERYYTDWYPLRLFRVGFAAYYDLGRAWGGELPNATPGWLSNIGFGLRILSARASFGSVVHIDFAVPIHRTDPNIDPYQLVVMTGRTF